MPELQVTTDDLGDITPRQWTERQLEEAVVRREERAWGELVRRHGRAIEGTARTVLRSTPAAADVALDVIAHLWESPHAFDPERGSLLAYLRICARRRSIDVLRSELRRKRREEAHRSEVTARPMPTAEVSALTRMFEADIRELLTQLPVPEREAIELAYLSELPYTSVARTLAMPEGTVKSRIRRGLRRLQQDLSIDTDAAS